MKMHTNAYWRVARSLGRVLPRVAAFWLSMAFAHAEVPIRIQVHGDVPIEDVAVIESGLKARLSEVIERMLDEQPAQTVTLQLWHDQEQFLSAMEQALGQRTPGSRGYITGPTDVRMLVTTRGDITLEAVHETVHALSLQLNPSFGNNPRWLWESVAQYYAGALVHPIDSGLVTHSQCVTLEMLNEPFNRGGSVYDAGFLIGEFVVAEWGNAGLIDLIKSNGDVHRTFDISPVLFEQQWCEFVRRKYLPTNNPEQVNE
ncbi:MAG: hypothetical protein AAFN07_07265 [Pseudomonadota bacterium]